MMSTVFNPFLKFEQHNEVLYQSSMLVKSGGVSFLMDHLAENEDQKGVYVMKMELMTYFSNSTDNILKNVHLSTNLCLEAALRTLVPF